MAFFLVVEDNPANVALISEVLEDEGHQFVVAQDGAAGLANAYNLMPDVILMDVSLPLLSGLDATTILKNEPKTRDIPVLALTAHAMDGDRDECLRAGCDDYETKPINTARVLQKADALMRARDPAFVMQLDRLRGQMPGGSAAKVAALEEQLAELQGRLSEQREAAKAHEAAQQSLQQALKAKEEALAAEQAAHRATASQADSRPVLRRLQAMEQRLTEAHSRVQELEREKEQASAAHDRARELMTELFEERMRETHAAHKVELARAQEAAEQPDPSPLIRQQRKHHAQELQAQAQAFATEKEALLAAHQDEVAELTRQAAEEREQLVASHEAALASLRSDKRKEQRRASASRRSALGKKLDEANATIAQLREQEDALRAKVRQLQDVPVEVQLLRAELQRARGEAANSRRVLAGLQAAVRQAVDASFTEAMGGATEFFAV